jgi:hypothetical protein
LAKDVQPPDKSILSRTLFNDDRLNHSRRSAFSTIFSYSWKSASV